MEIRSYIESGILELYVLGQLSPEEEKDVQDMQSKHIEIQREIHEISMSLEKYGRLNAIKVPDHVGEKLFKNLPPRQLMETSSERLVDTTAPKSSLSWNLLTTLFALLSILGFTLYLLQKNEHNADVIKFKKYELACDSITNQQQQQYALLNQINQPNNKIINMTPTPGFAGITVYLHYNETEQKNFLQLVNLPPITADQEFQLWSLKEGVAPIPMDIFAVNNQIIPVGFENNTATYAITIEPKGGSKTPSLDKLIGTIGVI